MLRVNKGYFIYDSIGSDSGHAIEISNRYEPKFIGIDSDKKSINISINILSTLKNCVAFLIAVTIALFVAIFILFRELLKLTLDWIAGKCVVFKLKTKLFGSSREGSL